MINRILIRIKAVQILYSYMLSEKHFSLAAIPEQPTKEKRFAYSVYMDMLVLMVKVAGAISQRGGNRPLEDTRFIRRLKSEDAVKSLLSKYRMVPFPYERAVDGIAERLKDSAIYTNFKKQLKDGNEASDTLWSEIYSLLIYPDPVIAEIASQRENYTPKGAERGMDMVNETFADFHGSHEGWSDAVAMLNKSLDAARSLYFRLLWLPVELTYLQERRLDERRHRHLTTAEDLNPNLKFVKNQLVRAISNCPSVASVCKDEEGIWMKEDRVMLESLLKVILDSEIYKEYMESPEQSMEQDAEFWRTIMRRVVFTNEHFLESLEDQNVFWNDDLDIIGTFAIKTFRRFAEGAGDDAVLEKFKDEEDARFGEELVKCVIRNREYYLGLIDEAVDPKMWESERLAFMDVVIVQTALAEILNFPAIPLTVSLNEYIEIAKSYSTSKSGGFVNGLLARIIRKLQEEGKLLKK